MNPERWESAKRLFHEALERPPADRPEFLAQAATRDPDLVAEVRALLAAETRGERVFGDVGETPAVEGLTPGTRLGPYEIERLLGAGGMGEVYKARDTRLDRTVAIKVLPARFARDSALRTRLQREARAISSLNHPHICTLYDVGEQDGLEFLVMEYLEGQNLADRLAQGSLPLSNAIQYAIEIVRALVAAHQRGIIHRDLKPANVMLTATGAKLLDFGIAKLRDVAVSDEAPTAAPAALTGEGVIVGTPQYSAPEQLEGKPIDARTDIFAFGVVLYEMVTGRKAFAAASRAGLIAAILERHPPALSQAQPAAPLSLEALVRRCLEKDRSARYARVDDLLADLSRVAAQPPAIGAALNVSPSGLGTAREASVRSQAGVTPPAHDTRSLGVLPFRELGGGRENQHLGLGLADATITELAGVRSLLVRPTAAILRYHEHPPDLQQAGRDLQVDAVVDGSFQRAGSRLRVTVQLVDTASGRPLWANKIDTTLDDIFTMQDEISRRIAEALQVELSPDEDRRLERGAGPSGAAYELYLKGRLHLLRETRDDFALAARHFEHACRVDPRFAPGWAALADVYSRIAFEYEPAGGWYEKSHEACARAFAIDPTLPEARYVRGLLLWTPPAGFDHPAAMQDMIAALSLRPNLDNAHTRLGIILQHVGLFEESARHLNQAVAISPGNEVAHGFRAGVRFHEGRFEEALERGRAISARGVAHDWVEYVIAHSQLRLGQAGEVSRRSESIQGWGLHSTLGVLAALKGDRVEVERRVRMAVEGRTAFGHFHHTQYDIACIHALLGDRESALEFLRQAARNGYPCGPFFERDPFLQPLRDTGDFTTLVADLESERQRYLHVYGDARSSARAHRSA